MEKYNKIIDKLMESRELYEDALDPQLKEEAVVEFNDTFNELTNNLEEMNDYTKDSFKKMANDAKSLDEAIEIDRMKKEQKIYKEKEQLINYYNGLIYNGTINLTKSNIRKLYKRNFKPVVVIGGIALAGALALGLKGCHKEDKTINSTTQVTTEATTQGFPVEKTTEVITEEQSSEVTTENIIDNNSIDSTNTNTNTNSNTNTDTNTNSNQNKNNKNNNINTNNNTNNNDNNSNNNSNNSNNNNDKNQENSKKEETSTTTEKRIDIDRKTTETKTEDVKVPTTEAPATVTTEENIPQPKTPEDEEKLTEEYPGDKEINEDKTVKPSTDEKSSIKDGESDEETYYFYDDIEASLNKNMKFKGKTLTLKLDC